MELRKPNGIFCLEADWERNLRTRYTVEHLLRLVQEAGYHPVRYIHRDVPTSESFMSYLNRWSQRSYADYPILYVATHGEDGKLLFGQPRSKGLDLNELEAALLGKCRNRIIYFSGCEMLSGNRSRFRQFIKNTQVLAIMGYAGWQDWNFGILADFVILNTLARKQITLNAVRAASKAVVANFGKSKWLAKAQFQVLDRHM
jgi:hypothetical protein